MRNQWASCYAASVKGFAGRRKQAAEPYLGPELPMNQLVSVARDRSEFLEVVKVRDKLAKFGGGQTGRKRHAMNSVDEILVAVIKRLALDNKSTAGGSLIATDAVSATVGRRTKGGGELAELPGDNVRPLHSSRDRIFPDKPRVSQVGYDADALGFPSVVVADIDHFPDAFLVRGRCVKNICGEHERRRVALHAERTEPIDITVLRGNVIVQPICLAVKVSHFRESIIARDPFGNVAQKRLAQSEQIGIVIADKIAVHMRRNKHNAIGGAFAQNLHRLAVIVRHGNGRLAKPVAQKLMAQAEAKTNRLVTVKDDVCLFHFCRVVLAESN